MCSNNELHQLTQRWLDSWNASLHWPASWDECQYICLFSMSAMTISFQLVIVLIFRENPENKDESAGHLAIVELREWRGFEWPQEREHQQALKEDSSFSVCIRKFLLVLNSWVRQSHKLFSNFFQGSSSIINWTDWIISRAPSASKILCSCKNLLSFWLCSVTAW